MNCISFQMHFHQLSRLLWYHNEICTCHSVCMWINLCCCSAFTSLTSPGLFMILTDRIDLTERVSVQCRCFTNPAMICILAVHIVTVQCKYRKLLLLLLKDLDRRKVVKSKMIVNLSWAPSWPSYSYSILPSRSCSLHIYHKKGNSFTGYL